MKIDCLILGVYQTNCYVLRDKPASKECLIIDTGLNSGKMLEFLTETLSEPVAVVLTHGHADHIAGLAELRKSYPKIKVYIHKLDAVMLADSRTNLSELSGQKFKADSADFLLEEGNLIEQAGINLTVLHTPGHTPGGICLYSKNEDVAFVGDTLFAHSVGRCDLPGGQLDELIKGIKEKLLVLPDQTVVYPGHGPMTTIGQEKTHNPFLL
ncbi:MAG: MBL fold metallo-hydrolase [Sedimentisphaerales bacterium]|nr:MBL fold metallo-hydrolase [Sedimentisphaerales bacterium]